MTDTTMSPRGSPLAEEELHYPASAQQIVPTGEAANRDRVGCARPHAPLTLAMAQRLLLPPAHPDTASYMRAYRARAALIRTLHRADALLVTYRDLPAPDAMADVEMVREVLSSIRQRIRRRIEVLRACARRGVLV